MFNKQCKGSVRAMVVAAFLGTTLGCGRGSPTAPTLTLVTPVTPVYTVTASTTRVAPAGQLTVSWSASLGQHNDWISLFKKGDLSTGVSWWIGWTNGERQGTFTLLAPAEPGEYEFRYLLDDTFSDAAVSSVVTVGTGAKPLRTLPK